MQEHTESWRLPVAAEPAWSFILADLWAGIMSVKRDMWVDIVWAIYTQYMEEQDANEKWKHWIVWVQHLHNLHAFNTFWKLDGLVSLRFLNYSKS